MSEMPRLSDYRKRGNQRVFFNRRELRKLLDLYSRRVATGEWRDYALDQYGPMAVFSIFRHSFDQPLYSIAKRAAGQGCEFVVFCGRRQLNHGKTVDEALAVLERQLRLV